MSTTLDDLVCAKQMWPFVVDGRMDFDTEADDMRSAHYHDYQRRKLVHHHTNPPSNFIILLQSSLLRCTRVEQNISNSG